MKKKISILLSAALVLTMLSACSRNNAASESTATPASIPQTGPMTINAKIPDKAILDKGPFGEQGVSAKTLSLSEQDIAKIKEGKYTAAIVFHTTGSDYMNAQLAALKAGFERLGIKVIATTDAQFSSEKQVSDIETVLAKKPDIIVSVPVDPVSTASAYKKAVEQGVKLVFMDGVAQGLQPGKDYISLVSGDNAGNGVEAANIMGEKLKGGKKKVGMVYYDADFFVTNQRDEAFEKTIKEKYPDIEIVAKSGFAKPNDAEKVAAAMLTKYPDLDGMYLSWDVPAEGAVAAARTAGANKLVITAVDLGKNVAIEIGSNGFVKGVGAQLPFDQGIAEVILSGYALLGKKAPSYITSPALQVTHENLIDSWKLIYGVEAPKVVKDSVK
ncbi:substrate-binding domain-containing protein [Paenibacillus polymyxa]|uniref:substrate-binding domain-containing protein n=1 Tax=Paenibacillus polymyxa TaxID=1406 RepID=UPI0020245953|nr:substrate-binding domain-containing protein [Paenibacillus polymyxa]URJ46962.3 substrate-binding domain-containing protein [Paenibacillus polymyxa]